MFTRTIPSTGEALPFIGLGTWQTFDAGTNRYPALRDVLATTHQAGGRLIDSSPMYGRAEKAIGEITGTMPEGPSFFYATKVWTQGSEAGRQQIDASYRLMKRQVMDLLQIHNLVDWKTHLPYLRRMKEEGRLRYIGLTHYQDSSHEALAEVIRKEPVDFLQFNYSLLSRGAENFLLPLCAELGVAVLINRPFGEGNHFRRVAHKPLPAWATEIGLHHWGSFFLAYILAHPAVTCVIPATSQAVHARENLEAGPIHISDKTVLNKMIAFVENL